MKIVTREHLLECLSYDPESGHLAWRERPQHHFCCLRHCRAWNARNAGKEAGHDSLGYKRLRIDGKLLYAHRLIFVIMTGGFPAGIVDHKNGDKSDNRWSNLIDATPLINQKNRALISTNTSGRTGVQWEKRSRNWRVRIRVNKKDIHIGNFPDYELACDARQKAEELYGFSKRHGKADPKMASAGGGQ